MKLSATFQELVSPNGRDVIYIDNKSGYWFGVARAYQDLVLKLCKGLDFDTFQLSS